MSDDNVKRLGRLLGLLQSERNGEVVELMERGGIVYPLSYGVNIPTIRALAREYAPDNEFARYLWQQQVRELMIAATVIADPDRVDEQSVEFWLDGLKNPELAEQVSMMISRSKYAKAFVERYMVVNDQRMWVVYAALLVMARCMGLFEREFVTRVARQFAASNNSALRKAAENVLVSVEEEL